MTANQLVAMLFPAIPVVFAAVAVLYFKKQLARQPQAAGLNMVTVSGAKELVMAEALRRLDENVQRDLQRAAADIQRATDDARRATDELRQAAAPQ